jgi:ERCC4-type nuclease
LTSKKSPSDPLDQVIVDTREPDWVRALEFEGAHVASALLETGDLLGMTRDGAFVLLERKTAGDLLASIKDGRLIAQAARMREVTQWAYLVVTESLYPGRFGQVIYQVNGARSVLGGLRETAWKWAAVQGALTTVQDLGVGVVWCGGDEQFGATARWLFERDRGPVAAPRRPPADLDERVELLCALPGVGPERARALLRDCGSVGWALYALTEMAAGKRKSVAGVGPATRLAVRRILGLKDGETLLPLEEP